MRDAPIDAKECSFWWTYGNLRGRQSSSDPRYAVDHLIESPDLASPLPGCVEEPLVSMARFQWEDFEQFIGLVNLLSLRDGQFQPRNGNKEEYEDIDVCRDEQVVWEGEEDELKQHFLDRFAEIMSRDKGGKCVCSAALQQSASRHPGEGVKISLLVARNHNFQKRDSIFCSTLERLLTAIAASVHGNTNNVPAVKRKLWEELVCYNQPRLDKGANRLRQHLRVFKASGSLDSVPPYCTSKLPQDSDSKCRTSCDDYGIGPYSEATHVDYMKLAQKHIFELDTVLCTGDRATQRRSLAEYTYSIRHMPFLWMFFNSCHKVSAGHRLLSDVYSLGRLKSCYYVLVNAALHIPGFARLSIVLVKNLLPRVCPTTLSPLAGMMKSLGQTLSPISVKKFISRKADVARTQGRFEQLQRKISQKVLHTHAELQLILYIARMTDVQVMKEIYPFIGCSKLSCFLCAAFLNSFCHRGIVFRTRGGHGKIYTRWSIPDMDGLRDDTITALSSALKAMRDSLVYEIFKPLTPVAHIPKISTGVTVHYTCSTHQHDKHPVFQCEVDSSSTNVSENSTSSDPVGRLETYNVTKAFEPAEIPMLYREYGGRAPETSGQSSQCNDPRLRIELCDERSDYRHTSNSMIGRIFDTADYLLRAFSNGFIAEHEVKPGHIRHECRAWFRENRVVLNSQCEHPDFLTVARPYLDPEDREKELCQLVPEAKRKSLMLYAMLLDENDIRSFLSDTVCKDLYFEFGLVTGRGCKG
ncbi:hypothetical protein EDC04DRAFT_2083362 [Pisolithus marmoratus]|nr:hypothetical protein EDC04DRAFT_2083362 [Pisolithus marmoratus]